MDSYNRGYGEGIEGLGGAGSQLGSATLLNVPIPDGSEQLGFFATAYSYDYDNDNIDETIISYRGTDV